MAAISFASKTDRGSSRPSNDDSLIALASGDLNGLADGLFIVADGMGGRPSGDVASKVTVETMPGVVIEHLTNSPGKSPTEAGGDALQKALDAANDALKKLSDEKPALRGMGTTCAALLMMGETAMVANIGDSRVYLLRGGALNLLTQEHSLIQPSRHRPEGEEQKGSGLHNVVTRGIGLSAKVNAYIAAGELREGDTLLLCSDGLSGVVPEPDVIRIMEREEDLQKICDKLVAEANRRGGPDNISLIVVRCGGFKETAEKPGEPEEDAKEETATSKPRGGMCAIAFLAAVVCFSATAATFLRH